MSEITELSSVLDQGIQKIEEDLDFRVDIPEIKAVRIFMTVHDGKYNGIICRKLEMNSWAAKQIRNYFPVTCMYCMVIFSFVFFGTGVPLSSLLTTLLITRNIMEKMFRETNKYTRLYVKSLVDRAFKELAIDAVDPKHIRECSIEIELSYPRCYPFENPLEKAYILCKLDNRGVEQLLL